MIGDTIQELDQFCDGLIRGLVLLPCGKNAFYGNVEIAEDIKKHQVAPSAVARLRNLALLVASMLV